MVGPEFYWIPSVYGMLPVAAENAVGLQFYIIHNSGGSESLALSI
jgi:hypothetical protein